MSSATLRTIVLSAIVAVVVWIFAEGESLSSRTLVVSVTFPIEASNDLVIRPEDPEFRGQVRVRLEATTRALDAAVLAVGGGAGGSIRLMPGTAGVPSTPGERQVVELREAIGSLPELRALGSTVAEVEPRQVLVSVVKMVSREVPIRVELPKDNAPALDGDPTVSPVVATMRVPEDALARLTDGGAGLTIVAGITESDVRRLRPEGAQTLTVPLRPPAELNGLGPIVLTPESTSVLLRIRRKVETMRIATVPVWYSLPPTDDAASVSVQVEDRFLTDVTLTGPADELQRVRSGALSVKAMIELSSEDLAKDSVSKPAQFPGLPAGVTSSASGQSIRVRIERRRSSGS